MWYSLPPGPLLQQFVFCRLRSIWWSSERKSHSVWTTLSRWGCSILYCKVLKEDEWRDIIATESVDFPSRREAMGLMWMTLVWSKSSWHMGHRNKWRRHSGSHKGGLITSLLSFLAVETAERITLTIWHCCILSIHMYVYIYIYTYIWYCTINVRYVIHSTWDIFICIICIILLSGKRVSMAPCWQALLGAAPAGARTEAIGRLGAEYAPATPARAHGSVCGGAIGWADVSWVFGKHGTISV